eukprot:9480853-Pyramimonas_sp.AAC.2
MPNIQAVALNRSGFHDDDGMEDGDDDARREEDDETRRAEGEEEDEHADWKDEKNREAHPAETTRKPLEVQEAQNGGGSAVYRYLSCPEEDDGEYEGEGDVVDDGGKVGYDYDADAGDYDERTATATTTGKTTTTTTTTTTQGRQLRGR